MQDSAAFWTWARAMPKQLIKHIKSVPTAGGEPGGTRQNGANGA